MTFIGRERQLKQIFDAINSDSMQLVLIYGRRRVGKSELVKQALKMTSGRHIYYECRQVTEQNNVRGMCELIAEEYGLPRLGYTSFEEVLDYIFRISANERTVLVLDEYPYLRDAVKGLDSIIQVMVDRYREQSGLTLIILGSYVDVMKSLLAHSNPLFGRVDLTIDLKQMDYYESSLFYPGYSPEDKVRMYAVFGGIPYYNRLVDDRKTVRENIIELIASPDARLENEVTMYLNSEISKISNANEVIDALSRGFSRYSDLLSQSHVSSGPTLIDVLDKLIRMEIVEKTLPINEEHNRKRAGYYICDNLSLFYYRYIFKYSSQLKIMDPEIFFDKYIADDYEQYYVPHRFEEICRQYLIRENRAGRIEPVIEKIGKYYYDDPKTRTNGEFDVVTLDETGYVFYEVKFRKQKLTEAMIEQEIKQVQATGLNCRKYVFISRSGFTCKETDQISLIGLEDLFAVQKL